MFQSPVTKSNGLRGRLWLAFFILFFCIEVCSANLLANAAPVSLTKEDVIIDIESYDIESYDVSITSLPKRALDRHEIADIFRTNRFISTETAKTDYRVLDKVLNPTYAGTSDLQGCVDLAIIAPKAAIVGQYLAQSPGQQPKDNYFLTDIDNAIKQAPTGAFKGAKAFTFTAIDYGRVRNPYIADEIAKHLNKNYGDMNVVKKTYLEPSTPEGDFSGMSDEQVVEWMIEYNDACEEEGEEVDPDTEMVQATLLIKKGNVKDLPEVFMAGEKV